MPLLLSRRPAWRRIAAALTALLLAVLSFVAPSHAASQDKDRLVNEWRLERDLTFARCAQRHYDLARWCWASGLHAQSTSELVHSLEVSRQRFKPAVEQLAKVRAFDGADWKKAAKRPSPTLLRDYEARARTACAEDAREHVDLAKWARSKKLHEEARAVYELLLQRSGDALELDAEQRLRLRSGTVPADVSKSILEGAVEINGKRYIRDEFLRHVPAVGTIFERESDALRVRSPIGATQVERLHALGSALIPLLEKDLGGRPTRRMELFVFATRASYESYLDGAALAQFKPCSGVADRQTYTAVICGEGTELDALVLHELAHLFEYGVTRGVLPDWYSEGFAETYGGPGTFTWDGKELKVGGLLRPEGRALLVDASKLMELRALFEASAPTLWAAPDKEGVLRFYAQSWAFSRFLRRHAGADYAARFAHWERVCRGAALGADAANVRASDAADAQALFTELFGTDLPDIELRFREYVGALK